MYRDRYTGQESRDGNCLANTGCRATALQKQVRYQAAPHPEVTGNLIVVMFLW